MTANIRMQLTEAERREANASPAFRLVGALPDPVETVANSIAALDDPKHLLTHVAYLARRDNYAEAATRLESHLIPKGHGTDHRLVETILNFGNSIGAFRMAFDLNAIGAYRHNRTRPKFDFTSLIALAANGKRTRQAWIAIHALGHVRSARGVIAIQEATTACPGVWPSAPTERIALAFNLLVRSAHGARFDSIHLVRS
ncbi:MAG: hypothetical protein Q8M24_15600 [Pseudolabrys sp.]|nr:hypothetical protein [Pseudolabrys sp.]MDP2296868.1 hypothetical protein [Pseudolabrys sp.]